MINRCAHCHTEDDLLALVAGCVHEHILENYLCRQHFVEYGRGIGRILCWPCRQVGRICPMLVRELV